MVTSYNPIAEICFDFWQNISYGPDHIPNIYIGEGYRNQINYIADSNTSE